MDRPRKLRLGTRGSRLAMAQAAAVAASLQEADPELEIETVVIRTTGDVDRSTPLNHFDTIGIFVKELERALLDGRIDFAVHSAKDLPTIAAPELKLVAFPARGPVHDVVVATRPLDLDASGCLQLPAGARVGTGSVRRRHQLLAAFPDLQVDVIRGNVDTRLGRLFAGDFDAIILAAAGLVRLGMLSEDAHAAAGQPLAASVPPGTPLYSYPLPPQQFVPAPGQGALAVQIRADERRLEQLLAATIHDPATGACLAAERAFLIGMGSSCAVPIGALAEVDGDRLRLIAYYADAEPATQVWYGDLDDPTALGRRAAAAMHPPAGGGPIDGRR